MPIEIKELIIKATVQDQPANEGQKDQVDANTRAEIIAECVEAVLERLRAKKER